MNEPSQSSIVLPTLPRWRVADTICVLAVFAVALVVRLVYLSQARDCPLFPLILQDAKSYSDWADRIVAGDWLGKETFYQAPLYPYFLAVLKLVGATDVWSIKVVQAVISSLSCAALFMAGRLFFSRNVGLIAGVLLAVFAPVVFLDTLIQKTVLATFLTCVLLWTVARAAAAPGMARFILAGAVLGLLMLTREETLLLVPVLGLWIMLSRRKTVPFKRRWMLTGAMVLGLCIPLVPVVVRNKVVGGEFVLTTSQAGPNFFIGNRAGADGTYVPLRPGRSNTTFERQDAFELAEQGLGHTPTPAEVSRYWFGQAWKDIRSQPVGWLKLMGRKAMLLVNSFEVPDSEDQYFYEKFSPLLAALSSVLHMGTLLPLAGVGVVLTLARRRELTPLYLFTGTIALAVVLFYVFGRYRLPIVAPLAIFAGAAVPGVVAAARARGAWRLIFAGAAGVACAVASNHEVFSRSSQLAAAYSNTGAALAVKGDDAGAIGMYQSALKLDAKMAETLCNLAQAQFRTGKVEEAKASMKAAVDLRPGDPRIMFQYGTLLAEAGDLPLAMMQLDGAMKAAPQDYDVRVNVAMMQMQTGMWGSAVQTMRGTIERFPQDHGTRSQLAWTLATCPVAALRDPTAAIALASEASAAANDGNPEFLDILAAAQASGGLFPQAIATAERAVEIAKGLKADDLAAEIGKRLAIYRTGKALHEVK